MSRDLKDLHPRVSALATRLIDECKKRGIDIIVTQTLRTFAEQDALYAKGRTKPGKIVTYAKGGQSIHNYGMAFDIAVKLNGVIDWNTSLYKDVGSIGKMLGLKWGGDFLKLKDYPHFEFTGGLTLADLKAGKRLAEPIGKAEVMASLLNCRESPSTSAKVNGQLKKGTVVTVYAKDEDWLLVNANTSQWVYGQFIKMI